MGLASPPPALAPPTLPTPPQQGLIQAPVFPKNLTLTPGPQPGLTNSVPLNLGVGGTVMGASNTLTNQAGGNQITFPAGIIGVLWHILWPGPINRWAQAGLMLVIAGAGLALYLLLGHLDPLEATTRACGMAVQSWANRMGLSISGVESLVKNVGIGQGQPAQPVQPVQVPQPLPLAQGGI